MDYYDQLSVHEMSMVLKVSTLLKLPN